MVKLKLTDKIFFKKVFMIAFPIAVHNFISSFQNIVDVIMIGNLGKEELAGVGFANQVIFIFILTTFGILGGASTFIAQYWGKKDMKNIYKIIGLSLVSCVFLSVIGLYLTEYHSKYLLSMYKLSDNVLNYGSTYLKINGYSFIIGIVGFCYGTVLRNTGKPFVPMYTSFIAVLINIILNYGLIYGNLGMPKLGVEGAAIATVIARYVDTIILMVLIFWKNKYLVGKFSELFNFDFKFIKRFFNISLPIIFQEILWVLGVNFYFIVYGKMGTDAAAAINVANSFERLAFVLFFGLATASAVIIGNEIGRGNEIKAFYYGRRFLKLSTTIAIGITITIIFFMHIIVKMFGVEGIVYDYALKLTYIFLIIFPVKVFNIANIIGVLRSGGDSKVAFLLEITTMWFIGVPLCFFSGVILKYPIYIVYIFICVEEIVKMVLGYFRFKSKRWIKNLVKS